MVFNANNCVYFKLIRQTKGYVLKVYYGISRQTMNTVGIRA